MPRDQERQGKKCARCRHAIQSDAASDEPLWFHRACLEEGQRALQRAHALAARFGGVPADGSSLLYSTYIGGSLSDSGNAIAVDSSGNAFVAGGTSSSDFPTTVGALQTTFNGVTDAFVLKLNSTGSALVYSTLLGGTSFDTANGLAVDGLGSAYVVGATSSTADFQTMAPIQASGGGALSGFVSKSNARNAIRHNSLEGCGTLPTTR